VDAAPLAGSYFDGRSARAVAARLSPDGAGFVLSGEDLQRRFVAAEVQLSPRLGRTARVLAFADGAQWQAAHDDRLDAWFGGGRIERLVDRLERRWRWVLGAAVTLVTAVLLLFTVGIPRLADAVAQRLPAAAEQAVATQVMAILERAWLDPSRLPRARRAALNGAFDALVADLPRAADYRLELRAAPRLGPNALALPGGVVVLTDELVALAGHDEELLAVLAHEAGHHEHRHALRSALQDTAVVLLVGLIAGDASSLGSLAVSVPTVLLQSGYSRRFEAEADAFAFDLLRRRGISPRRFADIMRKLDADAPPSEGVLGYISTHPGSAARIEAAERAAEK
jgi:Zn-dependent protease with chaperone function